MQKRLERQMLLTERLSTAGRLAAGVAHELNNPLATIAGCAEALVERAQAPELAGLDAFKDFPAYLELIEEEAYRCKEITGSLLQFVRDPGSRRVSADVNVLIEKALELLSHQPRFAEQPTGRPISTTRCRWSSSMKASSGRSSSASPAMRSRRWRGAGPSRSRRAGGAAARWRSTFADEGPGIPTMSCRASSIPSSRPSRPGRAPGLGLAIAQGIVADHGGRIEVSSRRPGATFRVILPQPCAAEAGMTRPIRVLVADDEKNLRELIVRELTRKGHRPTAWPTARRRSSALAEDAVRRRAARHEDAARWRGSRCCGSWPGVPGACRRSS